MSGPARCPDLYHAEILVTSNDGLTWQWKRLPETALDPVTAMLYAGKHTTPWRRVIQQTMVWDQEGEKPESNGCLPGQHCLSKSRDCMANGCIRELQGINAYDGVLMFICGDLIKSGKATT